MIFFCFKRREILLLVSHFDPIAAVAVVVVVFFAVTRFIIYVLAVLFNLKLAFILNLKTNDILTLT